MSKSVLLNVILAVALVVLIAKMAFFPTKGGGKADGAATPIENIMTRVSVRAYEDRPVEDEKIEAILRAAMAAPSAGNKQPWEFVVVTDRAILSEIAQNFQTIRMADKAPLAIIVCGDLNNTFPGDGLDYWVEDTSAATENLLLAAHSLGLGAVWCGIYPMMERVAYLKKLLKLPENIVPLNVIPVGYPAEDPAPKDKWKPEKIFHNCYGNTADSETLAASQVAASSSKEKGKEWRKIDPRELRDNPVSLFRDAMALTVGSEGKMNSMTIGWGGIGVLWRRPVVTVYVEKSRYTHQFMEDNEFFTVEAFTKDYDKVLKYLGTVSGRDEDKIKGSGLTVKFTDSGAPAFEEGRLLLECKKIYGAPFNPEGFGDVAKEIYSNRQLHSVYVGEIVNAWVKE